MATNENRDSRTKGWFYLDNELLEVFGGKGKDDPGIGIHAIGVYMVLAKHANNETQTSKPSYQTIATILGVSRNTVITAIKTLEKAGIISVEQRTTRDDKKVFTTNIYTLKNIKAAEPIPTGEPPSISDALPSARYELGVVQEVNHPSAPEVPELDLSNKTNLNKTISGNTARPPKSEALKIEEYFLKVTTGSIGFMSSMQREIITDLTARGFTLERCKPGIDQTIAEFRAKGKSISSIKVCIPAIVQLDPSNQPVFIQPIQQYKPGSPPPMDDDIARFHAEKAAKRARDTARAAQQQPVTA